MPLINNTGNTVIANATAMFLAHYRDPAFLDIVRGHNHFKFTSDTSDVVADNIANRPFEIRLITYIKLRSRAIAHTTKDTNGVTFISFNQALINNTTPNLLEQRVETLMHEFLHAIGYRHFTNFNWFYNRKTVPYKVAELFVGYLKTNQHFPPPAPHSVLPPAPNPHSKAKKTIRV